MARSKNLEERITAGELKKQLEADRQWLAEKLNRDVEFQLKAQQIKELVDPLEREIRDAGVDIDSYRTVSPISST